MSATYSSQLHLVTPNFQAINRCGGVLSAGKSIKSRIEDISELEPLEGYHSQSEQRNLVCLFFIFFVFFDDAKKTKEKNRLAHEN